MTTEVTVTNNGEEKPVNENPALKPRDNDDTKDIGYLLAKLETIEEKLNKGSGKFDELYDAVRGLNERVEMAERFASDAQATVEKAKQDIEEATETIAEEAVDEAVDKMTMDEAIGAVNVADALEQEGAGEPGNEPDNEPENRKRKFIKI